MDQSPKKPSTAILAAAGEHFVAYRLSLMGFPVALTRGGSQTVDLMVGDVGGTAAVSIQVKTGWKAWRRTSKTEPKKKYWSWFVGRDAAHLRGDAIFYAFVDLNKGRAPKVFIVPSAKVADSFQNKKNLKSLKCWKFTIKERDHRSYHERWEQITKEDFLDQEFLAYCGTQADDTVSLEAVRQALAKIPGSLTEDIRAERDEG